MIKEWVGGSLFRIEPARNKQDDAELECVAENGVGDPVSATAHLKVYESMYITTWFPPEDAFD